MFDSGAICDTSAREARRRAPEVSSVMISECARKHRVPAVQSSPPSGEDEEWGSEGEGERASEGAAPAPATSPTPPPPAPPSPAPKLRLNHSLATDPALRASATAPPAPTPTKAEPPASPADIEYLATLPSALQTAIVAGRLFCVPPSEPVPAPAPALIRIPEPSESKQVSGPVYVCSPCAIKFSSLSTLEAHQTYYCSHRLSAQPKVAALVAGVGGEGGGESEPEDVKPVVGGEGREESGGESTGEPATKSVKSGKLYRCTHCSYSADKKVSLNRHMRMHSSSPASQTSTDAAEGGHLIDRYCQDCDIRFSSLKTFKAHKMHYCSTRHVIKTKPPSAPSSPSESRTTPTSPGVSESSNHPPPPTQPFLALPTNPILIVPYSLFQGASILSGPAVMGLPAQDTACLLLPDGTLQPLAQGLLSQSRIPPAIPDVSKRQRLTSETIVKHSEENRSKNGISETPGAPLDLSVRTREEEGDLVIDMEEEDEKENRRSVDNQANIFPSPDPEDIICAPSIPLILSTSSTCSTPSPAPPSPALSSSSITTSNRKLHDSKRHRRDSQSSSPSPKSSPSGAKSPRRTPNGFPNVNERTHKSSDPKRKSLADSVSPPKLDSANNNLTLSSLLLAAAAHGGIDGYHKPDGLPFPPELVPHLTGARLPGGKGKQIPAIPGLIPATNRNLPLLLPKPPRTPADLMNPATILPLLTSEMALRIAAATGDPVSAPQVLVKQGVSKCQECNIVFCKHENFIAHKKHYCSARQLNEPVVVQDDDVKPASPAVSVSPPNTASPPAIAKDQSHSPVNPAALASPVASISKPPTLYQFICAACGIKFTSYDNLTAHQAYYCPKRTSTENEKGSRRCPKCKMTVAMDHVCGGGGGAWKCPCCHVVSPTASAAQKHMDTHTGVKAFLCTICRYKGNTLRGMRTHIRMHFDKRSNEIMEENYITCLVEDGSGGSVEIPAIEGEENHIRKPSENNNSSSRNVNVNGDMKVKVKQELEVGREEEEEEYIEVDEVATVKTDNSQDCKDTKNGECRTRFCPVSRVT